MAWMKVETSVARNRKFVKAGPGPSWLWICGLAYCQEGLTDGFIPSEALPYLGVKSAPTLVKHLVSAGLWDAVEGGWQVHDYLEHNKTAVEVHRIRDERAAGGHKGGRKNLQGKPSTQTQGLQEGQPSTKPSTKPSLSVDVAAAIAVAEQPLDLAFRQFQDAYPSHRRKGGHLLEVAFVDQCHKAGGPSVLMTALANHKTSEQWADSKLIPGMDTWLTGEYWRQVLPPPRPSQTVSHVERWKQQVKGRV